MMHVLHRFLLFHLLTCLGLHALRSEIINGTEVPEDSMLYMASVHNTTGHVCGGFLINEEFVMTAAHCDALNPTHVVLGTHNLKKVDNGMRYDVKRCKFPSYVNPPRGDDIMLLKLSRKALLGNRVQPIPLPNTEIKLEDKAKCRVAGWGYTRTRGKATDVLQMVDVPIINLQVCKELWRQVGVNLPGNVTCAGGYDTNKGFCQGDSGGPLVCSGMAVGVVSFNLRGECDNPEVPNIYTNISKYLPWINEILKKKSC